MIYFLVLTIFSWRSMQKKKRTISIVIVSLGKPNLHLTFFRQCAASILDPGCLSVPIKFWREDD